MALGAWIGGGNYQPTGWPHGAGNFAVLVGLLLGAGLGNKLVFLIERPDVLMAMLQASHCGRARASWAVLLGGLIGVEMASSPGQTRGEAMQWCGPWCWASASAVGCFIAGLHDDTYGVADHVALGRGHRRWHPRHPTPALRDRLCSCCSARCITLRPDGRSLTTPLAFKLFLSSYPGWRFVVGSSARAGGLPARVSRASSGPASSPISPAALSGLSYGARARSGLSPHDPAKSAPTCSTTPRSPSAPPACIRWRPRSSGRDGRVYMDKWCPRTAPSACCW